MGKIGGAPPRRGSPTDKARCGVGMPEGLSVGVPALRDPMGSGSSKGNPRNRHGEWALEERHGQHQAAKTNRQQNEARK